MVSAATIPLFKSKIHAATVVSIPLRAACQLSKCSVSKSLLLAIDHASTSTYIPVRAIIFKRLPSLALEAVGPESDSFSRCARNSS